MLTLDNVIAANPRKIWISNDSVWWTHDPKDLRNVRMGKNILMTIDCFGAPVSEYRVNGGAVNFFSRARIQDNRDYGDRCNRERNLMLAHAKNIHIPCERMPDRAYDLIVNKTFYRWCDENLADVLYPVIQEMQDGEL